MKDSIKTFADLKEDIHTYDQAEVVILPVPYEKTTTYGKGTGKGPQAILDASPNLEFYDEELNIVPLEEIGIATLPLLKTDSPPEVMVEEVAEAVSRIVEAEKIPLILGGEHSITIGAFHAISKFYDDLSVVQFDAHADLREFYDGSPFNHACVMRRIYTDAHICQIGIRAIDKEEAELIHQKKIDVFFAKDIAGKKDWQEKALSCLKDNVYLTFDVDAFDPSVIPATGTPEPGGLGWYEVLSFLKKLIAQKNIVGMDVVELSPMPDNRAPDFTVAKLIYKMIGYISNKKL